MLLRPGVGATCWGPWEGIGPGGTWVGFDVSAEPSGGTPGTVLVADGTAAYDGLSFVAELRWTGGLTREGTAMLYQGPPPPWAPLPSSAGE